MPISAASAAAKRTPTPAPVSDERPTSKRRWNGELIERHAQARSVDELPSELGDNAIIRDIVSMPPEDEARMAASIAAHREAEALYGEDAVAELAALEAGTHPVCRLPHAAR